MQFILKTPNIHYCGVTEGVQFENGIGKTADENVRNILVADYRYEDITPKTEAKKAPAKRKASEK